MKEKLEKIVVALGGNALQEPGTAGRAEEQLTVVKKTCEYIAEMIDRGYDLGIVHGNGPQVGRIVLASEGAKEITPAMPFDVCGAMSEGYIGYHLQQGLRYALLKRKIEMPVVTMVTQIVVNEKDPGFESPSKPIGPFYSKEEADEISAETGYTMKEDSGRGYRRVVASPVPKKIVEIKPIKDLWDDAIVISCGGGGIPVVEKSTGELEGVPAVIDKDLASELLAQEVGADALVILTEVEKVAINFNTPTQKNLDKITVAEAEKYIKEGHFAPGSMLPKVQAAIKFVKGHPERRTVITSLYKAVDALEGKTGTVIVNE